MFELAYFYAFITAFIFALASLMMKQYSTKVNPLWMNALKTTVAFFCFFLAVNLGGGWNSVPHSGPILAFIMSGLIGLNLGDLFMLRAFYKVGPSRTLLIYSFQPLFLGVASYYLFSQTLNSRQLFAILFLIGCVLTLSYEGFKKSGKWEIGGLLNAAIGALLDAVGILLTRYAFDEAPSLTIFEGNFYRCAGALIGFFLIGRYVKIELVQNYKKLKKSDRIYVLIASVLGTFIALWLWLSAISQGNLATVTAIGATCPMVTAVMESFWEKKFPSRYLTFSMVLFLGGFYFLFL